MGFKLGWSITADDAGELEKLRLFTRDNFSGQLEFEVSATALIGTTPLTVKREICHFP